jgi:hypothetical protein
VNLQIDVNIRYLRLIGGLQITIGKTMAVRLGCVVAVVNVARAAIAATPTPLAQMVGTSIVGAITADGAGWLAANGTRKSIVGSHYFLHPTSLFWDCVPVQQVVD